VLCSITRDQACKPTATAAGRIRSDHALK